MITREIKEEIGMELRVDPSVYYETIREIGRSSSPLRTYWLGINGDKELSPAQEEMKKDYPSFMSTDKVERESWGNFGFAGELTEHPFVNPIKNFYMTNSISRASETMAECTSEFMSAQETATQNDG